MPSQGRLNPLEQRLPSKPLIPEVPNVKQDKYQPPALRRAEGSKSQRDRPRKTYTERTRLKKHQEPSTDNYDRLCNRVDTLLLDLQYLQKTVEVLMVQQRVTRRRARIPSSSSNISDATNSTEHKDVDVNMDSESDDDQPHTQQMRSLQHTTSYQPNGHATASTRIEARPGPQNSYSGSEPSKQRACRVSGLRDCRSAIPEMMNGLRLRLTHPRVLISFVRHWDALVDMSRHYGCDEPSGGGGSIGTI